MPAPATVSPEFELVELFSSIQGEGPLLGCRQIFLRLASCNLTCGYCDTPFTPGPVARVEDAPGSGRFRSLPNPVSLDLLCALLDDWQRHLPGLHHSLSLTGGEPLCQADALAAGVPALAARLPLHLETNGTLPEALARIVPSLTWISMDLKLPSAAGRPWWDEHREFLRIAAQRTLCVKMVAGVATPLEELRAGAELLAASGVDAPLILQPVTVRGRIDLTGARLLELQRMLSLIHRDVRVIPQLHPLLGVA